MSESEAKKRLNVYGKNEIKREKKVSPVKIFISQFSSPIMLLLIAAGIVSFALGENVDAGLIWVIVFLSAVFGFVQDYRAEKAVEALKKMLVREARVIRGGKEKIIPAEEIVPGDIVVIEGGDVVPADGEVIEGWVKVDESPLTGESKAVEKKEGEKVYMGCGVYIGKAFVRVTETGFKTKIGQIAKKMQEIEDEKTPFQKHMELFAKKLVLVTIFIIIATVVVSANKYGVYEAFMVGVALAVAAIPEDLPAVITITLSLGAREMARRKALIRKLSVTESVGAVTVICTDKTGTLTEGKMKVVDLVTSNRELALKCCYYCNDARYVGGKLIGDETDIALKEFAQRLVKEECERIHEIPFSSERKMMSVVCKVEGRVYSFAKGAPEKILEKCRVGGKEKEKIMEEVRNFARKGFRVLALAYKEGEKDPEKDLEFLGIVVLEDPPRKEVPEAVKECKEAGIRVIMITGDSPETALSIAEQVGIETEYVLTGEKLDKMTDKELERALEKCNVFARTDPFHKLRILGVLKRKGEVVAMTGDGVNDALALKKADVGISMGIKGTEVAKEASDIILLDDNFATIRNAVKEGRRIFDNIRKFVIYLLSCNFAEVFVVFAGALTLTHEILKPVHLLWINLVTDGLPAIALSFDPARKDVMKRPPRSPKEGVLNKETGMRILGTGVIMALLLLGVFYITLEQGFDRARTLLFTGFVVYEISRIISIKEAERDIKGILKNKVLVFAIISSIALQVMVLYTPLAKVFDVVPLSIYDWIALAVVCAFGGLLSVIFSRKAMQYFKDYF